MSELLFLKPKNGNASKTLNKKLEKISDFSAGKFFKYKIVKYTKDSFHDVIMKEFQKTTQFLVSGELTKYGESLRKNKEFGVRQKKGDNPTIQDKKTDLIVLDLDDHIIKNFDPLSPEKPLKRYLKKIGVSCDITYQITPSQQLNSNVARIRLYGLADKEYSLLHLKAYAQNPDIQADGCVYTCSQPIYCGPPIINKGKDPIAQRYGFIKGKSRTQKLPSYTAREQEKFSNVFRGGEAFDYSDSTLPPEVANGSTCRRYFMPLAFHYVNKLGIDRQAVFDIIHARSMQVKNREFDAENVYAYIDDAIRQLQAEKEQAQKGLIASDVKERLKEDKIPKFPKGFLNTLPEPWPMIYKNFAQLPRKTNEPLLLPTILTVNAYLLNAKFITIEGRNPNFIFLNLAQSSVGKDVNSKDVIESLGDIFNERQPLSGKIFNDIMDNTPGSITSDKSLVESFDENGSFFWVNTEASGLFQQMNSANVGAMKALSDKFIEISDGKRLTGKRLSKEVVKSVEDPNCQLLLYAQPETIEQHISASMVDSGLFGRSIITIIPELGKRISQFKRYKSRKLSVDDAFFEFYTSKIFQTSAMSSGKIRLDYGKKVAREYEKWDNENIVALEKNNKMSEKSLKRVAMHSEQLYTLILGVCQLWDLHQGKEKRKSFDHTLMNPLLKYWAQTKAYAIENFVQDSLDVLHDGVMSCMLKYISLGYPKEENNADQLILEQSGLVNRTSLRRKLRKANGLIRKLKENNDDRNVTQRIDQIITSMIKNGELSEVLKNGKQYLFIPR